MLADIYRVIKTIDEAKNNRSLEDWESLKAKGFDKSTIQGARVQKLIGWSGAEFYLTEKGREVLRQEEMLDNLKQLNQQKAKMQTGIIFDSNIFDKICEGELKKNEIEQSIVKGFKYYITHIQTDEISNCPDEEKRKKLTLFLTILGPTVVGTESFVLGTSRLGFAKLSDGQTLEKLRKGNPKQTNDALIGEVAIKNGLILVSEDKRLQNKVALEGGKAIDFQQFKEMIK